MKSIDTRSRGSIHLSPGTTHVPFVRVEILLADAMHPSGSIERFQLGTKLGRELLDAVWDGSLSVSDPVTGGRLPRDAPWSSIETSMVAVADLRIYAAARNIRVSVGRYSADGTGARPRSSSERQEDEILEVIESLGYTPSQLPAQKKGQPTVKAAVRAQLVGKGMWTPSVLEHAWTRLRKQKLIKERTTK